MTNRNLRNHHHPGVHVPGWSALGSIYDSGMFGGDLVGKREDIAIHVAGLLESAVEGRFA